MNTYHIVALTWPYIFCIAMILSASIIVIVFLLQSWRNRIPDEIVFQFGSYHGASSPQYTVGPWASSAPGKTCDPDAMQFLMKAWNIEHMDKIFHNNVLQEPTKEVLCTLYQMQNRDTETEEEAYICGSHVLGVLQFGELDVIVSDRRAMEAILHAAAKLFPRKMYMDCFQPVIIVRMIPALSKKNANVLIRQQKNMVRYTGKQRT